MGTRVNHHSEESCDPDLAEAETEGTVTPMTSAHLDAPDGGWGWVVLVATILVLALTLAFPSCMGIFYTDLQIEFSASNSETSWVPSIMTAVLHAGGRKSIQEINNTIKTQNLCVADLLSVRTQP